MGAWLRWGLGILLNPVFPTLPLGTLTAIFAGGFIIGIMMTVADPMGLPTTTRPLVTTGFLGALTTFSTFSAETTSTRRRVR